MPILSGKYMHWVPECNNSSLQISWIMHYLDSLDSGFRLD